MHKEKTRFKWHVANMTGNTQDCWWIHSQLHFMSTHGHALLSRVYANGASFIVLLVFCFSSLCACLYQQSCQLSASGKSNYGPRSSLILMPKGDDAALDLAAWAAVTSDQVVTLMVELSSVCLCHREAAGQLLIHSSQGGGDMGGGGGRAEITIKESSPSSSSHIFSCRSYRWCHSWDREDW